MAIKPIDFFNCLSSYGVNFFTGVPDSLLKEFCLYVDDAIPKEKHVITANEGNAVALAAGFYLANKSLPLVYMQNSGLGNAVNPLLSLCDPDVYSIPMLIMVGWRGEPGLDDEPQHTKQGEVQLKLLESMDIPFEIISKDSNDYKVNVLTAVKTAINNKSPVVLLIKKGTFRSYGVKTEECVDKKMKREEALEIILDNIDNNAILVSTTGKTSREIFEIREKRGQSHKQDFLTVGSMGHCSSIALGIAISKPHRNVICIDGDGSMLMHLGSITSIANIKPNNFRHILINNQVHESVGGQPTAAKKINLSAIVEAMGTNKMFKVKTSFELKENIKEFITCKGPSFLEVVIQAGSRNDLGRPTINPIDNKISFMKFIEK